mgnify:CR=1 FL=1
MYKLTQQTQSRKISPKEAEYFLSLNNFPGQRSLNPLKVKKYCDIAIQGGFRPFNVSIATAPNGRKYMVNGQHCCSMVSITGRECNATIDYYRCDTDRDLWMLFASFDVHATRTQSQIIKGARGLLSNEKMRELPLRHLSTCGTALSLMRGEVLTPGAQCDKSEKVKLVDENPDFVLWSSIFHETPFLATVGVTTAMIATYRASKTGADKFWTMVKDGIGFISKQDPAFKLREDLRSRHLANLKPSKRYLVEYAISVSWWNSHRKGESRNSVKVGAMKELPKAI